MSLDDFLNGCIKVEQDVVAGDFKAAGLDLLPLVTELLNFTPMVGASPCCPDQAKVSAVMDCCGRIVAGCDKVGAVGGIFPGDGSVIKALVQAFLTIFPLIAPFLKG